MANKKELEKPKFNWQKTCKMLCDGLANFATTIIYLMTSVTLSILIILIVNCYKYLEFAIEMELEDSTTFVIIILIFMIAFEILTMLMLILYKLGYDKNEQ